MMIFFFGLDAKELAPGFRMIFTPTPKHTHTPTSYKLLEFFFLIWFAESKSYIRDDLLSLN